MPENRREEQVQDKDHVKSVRRALQLLRSFDRESPEWGVSDLARQLQLPKTIVFRLLATLEEEHFVEQNPVDRKYRLGRAIFEMATAYAGSDDLVRIGDRYLRELVAETRHTAQIGILEGRWVLPLVVVPSPLIMSVNVRPGDRRPVHATATGKILLAGLSDEEVCRLLPEETLDALTSHTVATRDRLLAQLAKIRQQGYAVNASESTEGIMAVAAPICNYQSRVVAGVSLSWPSRYETPKRRLELIQRVIRAGKELSERLGNSLAAY